MTAGCRENGCTTESGQTKKQVFLPREGPRVIRKTQPHSDFTVCRFKRSGDLSRSRPPSSPTGPSRVARALARSLRVDVNGVFQLSVGDNGAIWENHQEPGRQAEDFTNLYNLLARRPEQPVTFSWSEAAK